MFDKLSDAEVLALTDEQVERHIKLRCAEVGAKIVANPGEPQFFTIPQGDVVVFKVDGVDVLFKHRAVADAVRSILVKERMSLTDTEYDWNRGGSDYKKLKTFHQDYHGKLRDITVTEEIVYSNELYASVVADIVANKQLAEDHDKAKKEYQQSNAGYEEVKGSIWERVRSVRSRHAQLVTAWERFKEYVALAEGDREQGMVFYKKAYGPDQETVAFIEARIAEEVAASAAG